MRTPCCYLGFDNVEQTNAALNKLVNAYIPAVILDGELIRVEGVNRIAAMRKTVLIEVEGTKLEIPREEVPYISFAAL